MDILRNHTQGGFTIVNRCITKNNTLSLKERGLLVTLISLPDKWKFTANGLAEILPDGKEAVTSGLKALENKGYLIRHEQLRDEHGRFAGNVWEIFDTPQNGKIEGETYEDPGKPMKENPITVKSSTEDPLLEKPGQDIPEQFNNNNNINKELNNNKFNNQSFIQSSNSINGLNDEGTKYYDLICTQVCLAELIKKYPTKEKMLVNMVKYIVTTLAEQKKVFTNNAWKDFSEVKSRFLKLNKKHIENVLNRLCTDNLVIHNSEKYILAMLYNEPAKIEQTQYGPSMNHRNKESDFMQHKKRNDYDFDALLKAAKVN